MQDITGDGGVLKKEIRAGNTKHTEKPKSGDTVDVHYVGTLADTGTEFDSSREYEGQKPLRFTIGSSAVVAGFDAAVKTMTIGELSRFEIRSDWAYGEKGAPSSSRLSPDIKPGQTIVFELELMQILGTGAAASAGDDDAVSRVQSDLKRLALLREERAERVAERVAREEAKKAAEKAVAEAKLVAEKEAQKVMAAAAASSGGGLDRKAVKKMNPKALKAELKKRGLSIQGNKKVLQARLLETL